MCVYFKSDILISKKDIIVYKLVKRTRNINIFKSRYEPGNRTYYPNEYYGNRGKNFTYKIGAFKISRFIKSKGIHAYTRITEHCQTEINFYGNKYTILKLCIPSGTSYRLGEENMIVAEKIYVLKEVYVKRTKKCTQHKN